MYISILLLDFVFALPKALAKNIYKEVEAKFYLFKLKIHSIVKKCIYRVCFS